MSNIQASRIDSGRELGKMLRLMRNEAGLTLSDAATAIGRSHMTMSYIERNGYNSRLSLDELCKLLALYGRVITLEPITQESK